MSPGNKIALDWDPLDYSFICSKVTNICNNMDISEKHFELKKPCMKWFHLYEHSRTGKSNLLLAGGRQWLPVGSGIGEWYRGWWGETWLNFLGLGSYSISWSKFRLYRYMHLSKISKCTLAFVHFILPTGKNKSKKNWIYVFWRI